MRIAIVEDEVRIRKGLANLIQKISPNYQVVGEAENGKKGIELVLDQKPDLVITDIQMPVMDGLEMLGYFYEHNIMPKTVILSAYSEFEYAQKAIKYGVREYIIKPIMVDELTSVLRSIEQLLHIESQNQVVSMQSLGKIFSGLLKDQIIVSEELKEYVYEKFSFDAQTKFALLFSYFGENFNRENHRKTLPLLSIIRQEIHEETQLIADESLKSYYFIIPLEKEPSVLEKGIRVVLSRFTKSNYGFVRFYLNFFTGISEFKECVMETKKYMDWSIIFENEPLLSISKLRLVQTSPLTYPVIIEDQAKIAICMTKQKNWKVPYMNLKTILKEIPFITQER